MTDIKKPKINFGGTMKKYEFTGKEKVVFGTKLMQIRSLVSIEKIGVKPGEIGGWIEKETNLDHAGGAWVSGEAQVSGGARVSGEAQVSGEARVFGGARVSGEARIEKTEEYLMIGPIGSRNAILTSWKGENRVMVSTGCFLGSIDEFAKAVKDKHGETEFGKQYEDALKYISRKFKVK